MNIRVSVIFLLSLFILVGCYNFDNPVDPDAENYQGYRSDPITGWPYIREITVTNTGGALSDYQVAVRLSTTSMGSPYQNVNADGSDLRFKDQSTTDLSFWTESWDNTGDSLIWVKIPSIPAGSSTVYMTYGNASAVSLSDGGATFLFFDDFEDHAAGDFADGWSPAATYQVADDGGLKVLDDGTGSGEAVVAGFINSQSASTRDRFRSVDGVIDYAGLVLWYASDTHMIYAGPQTVSIGSMWEKNGQPNFTLIGSSFPISPTLDTNWHTQEVSVSVTSLTVRIDDAVVGTGSTSFGSSGGRTGFWSQYNGHRAYHDWHLVRKYATPEPEAVVGAEVAL